MDLLALVTDLICPFILLSVTVDNQGLVYLDKQIFQR